MDGNGDGGESPERKRKIPIRLGPPLDRTDNLGGDGEKNKKSELSEKQKERMSKQIEESQRAMAEEGEEVASEAETEGEDEFAKMVSFWSHQALPTLADRCSWQIVLMNDSITI